VLLGCAEAAAAGLGPAHVPAGARARLLHLARHGPGVATMPDDGLFGGWAGVAVALRAWWRVSGDEAAVEAATLADDSGLAEDSGAGSREDDERGHRRTARAGK